ncbi:GAF domain-containing protein [Kribbella sp. VKM Ac-2571]|uniref:GAF and ANTAR domain-containing protein n=1 Tax=Kribbella sp. VKM Ac-2571 TaxID=2512222 RepID=UPI00105B25F5|nr:GAF and ANTAR domain-containing protein [Kribbella sp. VKM Ac-2571]TDO56701.1 GAF domain-containing protein [Kribbella sp. VKM Ac-2571]
MDETSAETFTRIAQELHKQPDTRHTVQAVAEFALASVGADHAGVMLVHGGRRVEIAATTGPKVDRADQLQLELDEGPCLSAIEAGETFLIPDTSSEQRWPRWCHEVSKLGVGSVLSIRLATDDSKVGALNLYADTTERFTDDDIAVAQILGQHASIALDTAHRLDTLQQAVDGRTVIGQAQGILMERYDLDAGQAFSVLRRYSQSQNTKLGEVARKLAATRELPQWDD